MSQATRRLSALRRDIHELKARIRLQVPDDPDWYLDQLEAILYRDRERIEHRGQG